MGYRYRGPSDVQGQFRRTYDDPKCESAAPSPTTPGKIRLCALREHHAHDHYWVGMVTYDDHSKALELMRWNDAGEITYQERP